MISIRSNLNNFFIIRNFYYLIVIKKVTIIHQNINYRTCKP